MKKSILSSAGLASVMAAGSAMALPVGAPLPVPVDLTPTPVGGSLGACVQNAQGPLFSAVGDAMSEPTALAQIVGQSYDGIGFLGSSCGCLPPDTNAAVGNNFVVETVNVQIRVFNKTTGSILLDEPLSTFFGAFSGGDPYVVYDDTADRWYVSAFDSTGEGLFLAVSNDGNPLHGFKPTYHLTGVGGFPDYAKLGFNKDAIFISYNDFGSGGAAAAIASIDKAAALSGTLIYYVSHPIFQFRAMPPAQMHGDEAGGVEWFVSTDGTDFGGSTIRVTKMTNYLTNAPSFTYTSLPVAQYRNAERADQPGGSVTTFPNTTTTQVQYRNGHLVTAMASSTAADGFVYPKGLYYQIDVSCGEPTLLQEGVIDPGEGVAVQMPSVDEDSKGGLGLTWMESSSSEYLSMWVGTIIKPVGQLAATVVAPGGGFFFYNFRIGDYSTTVLDPSDGRTFWSANEYIGPDGDIDIWRTHIASFIAGPVSRDQCKHGGWENFGFKNQGQCIAFVNRPHG
ncbi:hypothetical protein WMF39_22320 [Sorangium sp. So ce1504]|uniref:hypothetical protein n=1 Tax=Sorangium sp. So ce1504 TaxID=3133337 RepID=UPI003F61C28E